MPVVARYGQRKVTTDALAGVRKTAAETPISEGAGLAEAQGQTAEQLGRLAGTVGHLATQEIADLQAAEQKRANDVATMEYDTALSQWANKRMLDPSTGALGVMGKDALGQPEKVMAEFNQVAGALESNFATDEQRARGRRIRAQHAENLDAQLQRHTFEQVRRYESDVVGATVETAHETAAANASDPRRVGLELQKGVTAITTAAPRFGWGPEVVQKKIDDFQSATHTAIIERLLDGQQTMQARVYFEEKGSEITDPKQHARVMDMLKVGASKADAQRVADQVLAAGGTLTEQRDKVKKQLDGDARDQALQYLDHEASLKSAAERQADESLLDQVYARLKRNGGDLRSITAAEEVKLGKHLPGLKNFSDDLAKGTPRKSDKTIYYTMLDQAEKEPANFATLNLRPLMTQLDETDYDHLDRAQRALRAGDKKAADKELDDWRSEKSVVDTALQLAGLDPSPKPDDKVGQDRVARFQSLVAAEARRVQEVTKKKLGNEDLEAIANRILGKQITDKGWFSDSTRSLLTATPADIPPAAMKQITDSLQRAGQAVTPEAALAVWLKAQARGVK